MPKKKAWGVTERESELVRREKKKKRKRRRMKWIKGEAKKREKKRGKKK